MFFAVLTLKPTKTQVFCHFFAPELTQLIELIHRQIA